MHAPRGCKGCNAAVMCESEGLRMQLSWTELDWQAIHRYNTSWDKGVEGT